MPSQIKGPKEKHKGIWRLAPLRLMRWIDAHGSPALTKYVVGILVILTVAAFGAIAKHIDLVIRILVYILSSLKTEILLELWLLLLCMIVPLSGVLYLVWIRLRRPVIHSAEYGANARPDGVQCKPDDVRWKVEKEVRHGGRRIPAENLFFGEGDPEYDPCRDVRKSLTIDYCVHGDRKVKTVAEHQHVDLD